MKPLYILIILLTFNLNIKSQESVPLFMEILTQTTHLNESGKVKFVIKPYGTSWCMQDYEWYITTSNTNKLIIEGNSFGNTEEYGFNVCYSTQAYPKFWLALNKMSIYNYDNSRERYFNVVEFYIDYRVCGYGNTMQNDITIRYDDDSGKVYLDEDLNINGEDDLSGFETINNNQIFRYHEIQNYSDFSTSCIPEYWQNSLVLIKKNNHPRLVWGAHPTFDATNYKLYRGITENPKIPPSSYNLIYTSDASTFNFTDIEMNLNGTGDYAFYYVKAYNSNNDTYSSSSNEVNIYGEFAPYKYLEGKEQNPENQTYNYKLNNYPNPFNPTTTITYSLPEKQEVQIRVYDPFGREIAELVNGVKEKGKHSVKFDGSNLTS